MDAYKGKSRPANPRAKANPISAVTFGWILSIFWNGMKRELNEDDLPEPLPEHKSSGLGDLLQRNWEEEVNKARVKKRKPSLLRAILSTFGFRCFIYGLILLTIEALRIVQPLFLGQLINYFTPKTKLSLTDAYLYALGVILCNLVVILLIHPYMLALMHLGMKARVGCCSLVYRKALKLSKTALNQTTTGQVVNLLSNDVNRFDLAVFFLHYLWIGPLETLVVTYFMWQSIGISALVGVGALLAVIPIQAVLGKMTSVYRLKTAIRTDERVRLMSEIINGMQVIKMYTWEIPFSKLVAISRRREVRFIRATSYIRGSLLSFNIFTTRFSIFISVIVYVILGNDITAEKVFVVSSYYNILRQAMTIFFPQGIGQVSEALVSTRRLQNFLLYEELGEVISTDPVPEKDPLIINKFNLSIDSLQNDDLKKNNSTEKREINSKKGTIIMKSVSAQWLETNENTLKKITLSAEPGKLLAVVGPVGAGKSSLLYTILKELPIKEGSLQVDGKISYASQEPWLFAGSVRQNILFGKEYVKDRYKQVVKVCSLLPDFKMLPYGDHTVIGDRGVSLSGGQRARVNLARAVYADSEIYLLDDPLSAVDTHVGTHLYEECIRDYLSSKTVVLVTHQLQYLALADHIIILEEGSIAAQGTYDELKSSGLDFAQLLCSESQSGYESDTSNSDSSLSRKSISSLHRGSLASVAASVIPDKVEEVRSHGSIGAKTYGIYLKAGGHICTIIFMLTICIITQVFASGADYWLTFWTNLEENRNVSSAAVDIPAWAFTLDENVCMYIYMAIAVLLVVITLARTMLFFMVAMRSSVNLHDRMFSSITSAPMRFFDTNPGGRILNRFSKDMGAVDELLPNAMLDSMQIGLLMIGIIVVICIVNLYLLLPTFLVAVLFYFMRRIYVSTSRNVKRLEGITRSPVFSHLNATLQGLTTIRAFGAEKVLIDEFDNHQDLHSSAWYLFIATSRAFGYWLDLFCCIYFTLVTLSFLIFGESLGGNVGLAITQCLALTGMLQWGMRQSAEMENQMTSVERIGEYTKIDHEPGLTKFPGKITLSSDWPIDGCVEFKHVYLNYSKDELPVLKDLTFKILAKQKVGVVGRTGAGKSSIIAALFRLAPLKGEINIDGVDTSLITLPELRSKLSIIPQEPVLFSGTMRNNLDPFDEHSDEVLWKALEEVDLKDVVKEMAGGLTSRMAEGGSNFSVGQRQLVCLARAIIRQNKILILDEATANVDPKTDALVQKQVRNKFSNCTVITIAHRLHTVMDSDIILVMDAGRIAEFGHPYLLLKNKKGILHGMVLQTGKNMADNLKKISKENYLEKNT